jgi:hypothetical protein
LNLGVDPEVVFTLTKMRSSRDHIWLQLRDTSTYKEVGADSTRVEPEMHVAGWDDHTIYRQQIRNYTGKPIDVEIRRSFDGHVVFRSALEPTQFDFQTAQFGARVAPGEKKDVMYEIVQHQQHNAKQNNVTLENAKIE